MNRALTQICFVSVLFGISSIATAEKQVGFPSLDIPEGKAAIYLYRDKKFGGGLIKHRFFINKTVLIPIGNGGCSVAFVDPGKTLVDVESGGFAGLVIVWTERLFTDAFRILSLDVDPGKSYFLKFVINETDTLAPTSLGHSLYLVPEAEGLNSTKKCKYRVALKVVKDDA